MPCGGQIGIPPKPPKRKFEMGADLYHMARLSLLEKAFRERKDVWVLATVMDRAMIKAIQNCKTESERYADSLQAGFNFFEPLTEPPFPL